MSNRLPPQPGEWIDRTRALTFRLEGREHSAFAGDTLSSALAAAGVRTLGRSFKYHRPRGVYSAAGHDCNAMFESDAATNVRGDTTLVADGMDLRPVNAAGSLAHDRLNVVEKFSRFLPVGFYYKAFHTPRRLFPLYERQMRRVAGLGHIKPNARLPASPKDYDFCDLLVVGAGAAGLSAAIAAAECGVDVLVVDQRARPGGSLCWQSGQVPAARQQLAALLARTEELPNLCIRAGVEAAGWYADHWIALVDSARLTKLRARATLVAAGAIEQPAVFGGNDLPGVMLASAAQRLARLYAVRPGQRAVVLAANLDAYRAALDLIDAGVQVAALVDLRFGGEAGELLARLHEHKVEILAGHAVYEAVAGRDGSGVAAAVVCPLGADGAPVVERARRIDCDLLAMSVGWAPAGAILYQAGAKFAYDDQVEQFTPRTLPEGVFAAGRVRGVYDLEARLADGRAAGLAAASHLGKRQGDVPRQSPPSSVPHSHGYPIFAHAGKKNFVDLDEDLHLADFKNAHQEGYDNIELLKRYSTVGMGPSQGKLANMNAVRILARLNGRSIDETGTTTSRPFFNPVSLGCLAGRRFHPLRRTPQHAWHAEHGARFVHAGAWLRPEFYPRQGKSREQCVLDEALAVRQSLGMIDVGTLGKLIVSGSQAGEFLERVYTGKFAEMKPGKLRYALACDETGVIIEDGLVARLDERTYFLSTTTTGSASFYAELQRWAIIWRLDAAITNVTGQWTGLNFAGPRSREILAPHTEVDLSSEAFPFPAVRRGTVAGAPALLMRVGFVGELGYEIHVPASHGMHVWRTLWQAGESAGIRAFGVEAQRLLRLEKGHLIVSQDTDALTTPIEAGLEWALANKPFFIGQRSLRIAAQHPPSRKLVGFELPREHAGPWPEECCLVVDNGRITGRVSSIARRSTVGRPIGLAFVAPAQAQPGATIRIRTESGRMVDAEIVEPPFYDPRNLRQS